MELRDPVSSASHLLTAVWAVFATLVLLRITRGGPARRAAVLVYGFSMVALYAASGVFHGLPLDARLNPARFKFYQTLDQSAIFVLIAGTCTPPVSMLLGGRLRPWFLSLIWAFGITGIVCLWFIPKTPYEVIVGLCLGMGWLGTVPVVHYYRAVGWRAMNLVWLGALSYTLGGVCELLEGPVLWPGWVSYHEVFHFFVMAGSVFFFVFIVKHVIPYRPLPSPHRPAGPPGGPRQRAETAVAVA